MNNTLKLLALQHELGMAISPQRGLRDLLEQCACGWVGALRLEEIDFWFRYDDHDDPLPPSEQSESRLRHACAFPLRKHRETPHIPPTMALALGPHEHHLEIHQSEGQPCFAYHFPLGRSALVTLHHRAGLPPMILQLLGPLFERLAEACQMTIEHEQLIRLAHSRQETEQQIHFQIFRDELTKLPNRRLLMEYLTKDIARSIRHGFFGAVLFLDLNRFKVINDTLGHSTGDLLLVRVAELLQSLVRREDTVARLSGDEFVIQLSRIKTSREECEEAIQKVLDKIHYAFSQPLRVGDHMLHVTPSVGVEIYPGNAETADEILHHADIAMYQAKAQGMNVSAFYDQKNSQELKLRLELEKELHDALESLDEFELYYQPQFRCDGTCIGAEALVRWNNPRRGRVSPARFIPIAEETGLMLKLGRWVLAEACKHLGHLQQRGLPPAFRKLSVNVSAIQFSQKDFVPDLLSIIEKSGASKELLGIELTESALIKNIDETVSIITELRSEGVTTSIDDFGTGYSSLAYITRFPIETLKIDRMFVHNIERVKGNRAVVDTIMVLGKNLDLSIIAEGVETEEELKCLREFNCQFYQGFLFSRPLPFDEFVALLDNQSHDEQPEPLLEEFQPYPDDLQPQVVAIPRRRRAAP